jgi:hypothetical protein
MTQGQDQDQRGPGYVVRGDAVPEDEEYTGDQTKPMTRFQKVASALRGAGTERDERDEYDEAGADRDVADRDVQADHGFADRDVQADHGFAGDRDVQADRDLQADQGQRDYWDDPAGRAAGQPATSPADRDETIAAMDPDVPVDQTNPDVPIDETRAGDMDHPATEPDLFGNTTRPASETGTVPPVAAAEGQPGAATIADVPGGASVTTATGAQEADVPEAEFRAAGTPETATAVAAAPAVAAATDVTATDAAAADAAVPAAGTTGRHAAAPADVAAADAAAADAAPADRELRPGEATVSLGDFSDLTYGNLIPDTAVYTEQWQQIQFKFVDDPHASVTEAADVVAQVTAKMEAAIQERQRAIQERQQAIQEQQRSLSDRWGKDNNADTENLRETLRMYKTFLDQLIGPRATS